MEKEQASPRFWSHGIREGWRSWRWWFHFNYGYVFHIEASLCSKHNGGRISLLVNGIESWRSFSIAIPYLIALYFVLRAPGKKRRPARNQLKLLWWLSAMVTVDAS